MWQIVGGLLVLINSIEFGLMISLSRLPLKDSVLILVSHTRFDKTASATSAPAPPPWLSVCDQLILQGLRCAGVNRGKVGAA